MKIAAKIMILIASMMSASVSFADGPIEKATATTVSTPLNQNYKKWQMVDLSKIIEPVKIKLKLPPHAVISKNLNGNADIQLGGHSVLTVAPIAVVDVKEAMQTASDFYLNNEGYSHAKKIMGDSNGFVYTRQMKTEQNGHTYPAQSHFVYYLTGKDGVVYEISEDVSLEGMLEVKPGDFTEARAKTLYQFIKQNAQVVQ